MEHYKKKTASPIPSQIFIIEPLEITSASGPIPPFAPGEPQLEITLKNISNVPINEVSVDYINRGPI